MAASQYQKMKRIVKPRHFPEHPATRRYRPPSPPCGWEQRQEFAPCCGGVACLQIDQTPRKCQFRDSVDCGRRCRSRAGCPAPL